MHLFVTPWTVAHQVPLSMEFSRQEYLSGLPFPIPGDFPDPGPEATFPVSPAVAGRFFNTVSPEKAILPYKVINYHNLFFFFFFFFYCRFFQGDFLCGKLR